MEVLKDGTELHLESFCLADAELRLEGADDPMFVMLKAQYADVLGEAPQGKPPDSCLELELETGDARMPRSRPLKLSCPMASSRSCAHNSSTCPTAAGSSIRPQDTLWQSCSPASRSWRICYDYRGLNAITRPAVEPLPHIDALLLDGT